MEDCTIALKIRLSSDDVRRLTVSQDIKFEQLYSILGSLHNEGLPFSVTYIDDELDKITITCDEELKEAIYLASQQQNGVLRLQLDPPENDTCGAGSSPVPLSSSPSNPSQATMKEGPLATDSVPVTNNTDTNNPQTPPTSTLSPSSSCISPSCSSSPSIDDHSSPPLSSSTSPPSLLSPPSFQSSPPPTTPTLMDDSTLGPNSSSTDGTIDIMDEIAQLCSELSTETMNQYKELSGGVYSFYSDVCSFVNNL